MKYIKTYEANKEYNIGDYVLVNIKDIPNDTISRLKIPNGVNFEFAKIKNIHTEKGSDSYQCEFKYGTKFYMYKYEIIRKMTKKEIEEHEMFLNTNKYNL